MKFEPAQNQWNNGKAVSFYPVCVFYEWVRALMCSFKVEWWKNILFRGHQSCYTIHNVYFTFCFLFPLISSALWTALFINNWQVFPYVIHPASSICKIHKSDSSSSNYNTKVSFHKKLSGFKVMSKFVHEDLYLRDFV